jgi:hypothetical protein
MSPNQLNQMQTQNIPASDQVSKNKTIYDVSGFEVFWRNFIAGMGRAVGGLFLYFIIFVGIASLVNKFLMPHILPLLDTLQNSVNSLNQLSPGGSQNQIVDQVLNKPDIQNIIDQVKK